MARANLVVPADYLARAIFVVLASGMAVAKRATAASRSRVPALVLAIYMADSSVAKRETAAIRSLVLVPYVAHAIYLAPATALVFTDCSSRGASSQAISRRR